MSHINNHVENIVEEKSRNKLDLYNQYKRYFKTLLKGIKDTLINRNKSEKRNLSIKKISVIL